MAHRDGHVRDLLDRVDRLLREFQYDEALPLARQAVALAPRSLEAWRELGSTCGYAGRPQEMRAAFTQALDLVVTPEEELETWYARGHAENTCNQWADAVQSFARLAELEPEWGMPWLLQGMALGNMGVFIARHYHEEALCALKRALALSGLSLTDRRVAYFLMDKSLSGLGRMQEAEAARAREQQLRQAERDEAAKRPSSLQPPQLH